MNDIHDRIKNELYPLIKARKGFTVNKYTVTGKQQYRGKIRYVAGYTESRSGSHYASGLVYDRIMGWGETQEAAFEMMKRKLTQANT